MWVEAPEFIVTLCVADAYLWFTLGRSLGLMIA